MAFLDNSGDIILDAVLTDTGRFRLAKGDGSFRITKFALADDEINYRLYNKNNPSGSAYYDLEILQTPVMEAFTNNTSTMQHKLLSIPRTNLLYLPEILVNGQPDNNSEVVPENNGFAVAVTDDTWDTFTGAHPGVMPGETTRTDQHIRLDQGLNTTEISWQYTIDQDLKETQYIVEIDSRLGIIADFASNAAAAISFIDDDNIASIYLSQASDPGFVKNVRSISTANWSSTQTTLPAQAVIQGPQGTALEFRIKSTIELISSDFLFDQLGAVLDSGEYSAWGINTPPAGSPVYKYIDSIVKITGATTGYRIDIPVRFIKCATC